MRLICRLLLLLCLALGSAGPASAQDTDELKTAREGLTVLTRFPGDITRVTDSVRGLYFGPGGYNISCEYQCLFAGFCFKWAKYHNTIDFSWLRDSFRNRITSDQDEIRGFVYKFQWDLSNWARTATADSAAFAELDTAIKAMLANPTDAGKQQIQERLKVLAGKLDTSRGRVQQLMQQLAKFLGRVNQLKQTITQAKGGMEAQATSSYASMESFIAQQPCGHDEARKQFGNFKTSIAGSLTSVDSAAGQFAASASAADRAGSMVLGTLLNFVGRYQTVSTQVAKAQNAVEANSVIVGTHIQIVNAAWRRFLEYLTQQFPPENVKGPNVKWVSCAAGGAPKSTFYVVSSGTWREDASNGARFNFVERARDEWSVYMVDAGRKIDLQIDLWTKLVTFSAANGPRATLCTIDGSQI
jgi:hypothetical protein